VPLRCGKTAKRSMAPRLVRFGLSARWLLLKGRLPVITMSRVNGKVVPNCGVDLSKTIQLQRLAIPDHPTGAEIATGVTTVDARQRAWPPAAPCHFVAIKIFVIAAIMAC
jgi:hypothetical protein